MVRAPGKRPLKIQSERLSGMSDDAKEAALDELTARFDASLASLKEPETKEKARRAFAAKGKLRHPPKAGETF